MTDWTRRTAASWPRRSPRGSTTSEEVTTADLDRIAAVDGTVDLGVHAFLHVAQRRRSSAPWSIDERIVPELIGLLAGVPVVVKDVVATRGLLTMVGLRIFEAWVRPTHATWSRGERRRPRQLGNTNMDEFAMGWFTDRSAHVLPSVTCGTSAGSRAAPARVRRGPSPYFEAPLAIGNDTVVDPQPARAPASVRRQAHWTPGDRATAGRPRLQPRPGRPRARGRVLDAASLVPGRGGRPDWTPPAARPARAPTPTATYLLGGAGRPAAARVRANCRRPRRRGPRARRRG